MLCESVHDVVFFLAGTEKVDMKEEPGQRWDMFAQWWRSKCSLYFTSSFSKNLFPSGSGDFLLDLTLSYQFVQSSFLI